MMQLTPQQHQQFQLGLIAVQRGLISSECLLSGLQKWLSGSQDSLTEILLSQSPIAEHSHEPLRQILCAEHGGAIQTGDEPATAEFSRAEAEPRERYRATDEHIALVQQLIAGDSQLTVSHVAATADYVSRNDSAALLKSDTSTSDTSTSERQAARQVEHRRFRIEHQLAAGGLGVVYQGTDLQLNRAVAIKKIQQRKCDQPLLREKFLLEAEVTGQLEHPGIVPIYALVTDQWQESYYAMRLIRGQDLAQVLRNFHRNWLGQTGQFDSLEFRGLLRRFIDVCNTIAYAHSRGVLHRDLKPANIMLGPHGETLVVDWGLAKVIPRTGATDADAASEVREARDLTEPLAISSATDLTLMGSFAGTPRYAAPEQLAGRIDCLSTQTDIYSLGSVFYELLTGQPPLSAENRRPADVLRALQAGGLQSPRTIIETIPRPLEAICQKAMQLEPVHRYSSATLLAQDVERWLADARVMAYQDEPAGERLARWLRHHRSWTLALAVSLVVIAAISIGAGYWINRARVSELLARQSAQEFKGDAVARYRVAKQAVDLLVERSEALRDVPGSEDIRLTILQEAIDRYAALSESESPDPELEIERVRALVRLADVRHLQGMNSEAQPLYQQAVTLLSNALGATSQRPPASASMPQLMRAIELGRTYQRMGLAAATEGELVVARQHFAKALGVYHAWQAVDRSNGLLAGNWAIALNGLAELEIDEGQPAQAVELLQQSKSLFQETLEVHDAHDAELFTLANIATLESLGRALRKTGQHIEAKAEFQHAIARIDAFLTEESSNPRYQQRRSSLLVSMAESHRTCGDWLAAATALAQARDGYTKLCERFPDSLGYAHHLVMVSTDLGLVLLELEDWDRANASLHFALERSLRLVEYFPQLQSLTVTQAVALNGLGQLIVKSDPTSPQGLEFLRGALEKLSPFLEEAIETDRDAGTWALELIQARHRTHYARALMADEQMEMARVELARAIGMMEACQSSGINALQSESDLAHAHWHAGWAWWRDDPEVARQHFNVALDLWRNLIIKDNTPLHQYYLALAYKQCPEMTLRNEQAAQRLSESCCRAVPDNAAFAELLR